MLVVVRIWGCDVGRLGCGWLGSDEVVVDKANGVPTFELLLVVVLTAASLGFLLGQVGGFSTVGGAKGVATVEDKVVRAFAAAHNTESPSIASGRPCLAEEAPGEPSSRAPQDTINPIQRPPGIGLSLCIALVV